MKNLTKSQKVVYWIAWAAIILGLLALIKWFLKYLF